MSADGWGPLPALSRHLVAAPALPAGVPANEASWRQVSHRYGGLWTLPSVGIWHRDLRPPAADPAGPERRRPRWLKGWPPRWLGRLRLRPGVDLATVTPALVACQQWLAARNLEALATWLAPLWQSCPLPLTAVTQRGLAWCLHAAELGRFSHLAPAGPGTDRATALDGRATLGDCLAVHLCIERLVEQAARHYRVNATNPGTRVGGGLRRASFLAAYPALVARGPAGWGWSRRFRDLVAASPLTRLVYLDVIGAAEPLPPCAHLTRAKPSAAASELLPGDADSLSWGELWLTQVARSVVGAVLSGPPATEAMQRCAARAQAAEAAARARLGRDFQRDPVWQAAAAALETARDTAAQQEGDRILAMPRLLGLTADDPALPSPASPFLALRVLDMLVRRAVAGAGPQLAAQWSELDRTQAGLEPRAVLFASPPALAELVEAPGQHRAGAAYLAVARVLFGWAGMPPLTATGRPAEPHTERLAWTTAMRDAALAWLTPEVPEDLATAAAAAGLGPMAARRLVDRFGQKDVPLAFAGGEWRSLAPQDILAEHLLMLAASSETETTTEIVQL